MQEPGASLPLPALAFKYKEKLASISTGGCQMPKTGPSLWEKLLILSLYTSFFVQFTARLAWDSSFLQHTGLPVLCQTQHMQLCSCSQTMCSHEDWGHLCRYFWAFPTGMSPKRQPAALLSPPSAEPHSVLYQLLSGLGRVDCCSLPQHPGKHALSRAQQYLLHTKYNIEFSVKSPPMGK